MYNKIEDFRKVTYRSNYLLAIICNICMGTLFFGYNMGVYNPLQSYLENYVFATTSSNLVSLAASLVPIGAGIGAFFGGFLASKVGRLKAFIITDTFSILATAVTILPSIGFLLVGRFFVGVCVGLNSTLVPLYLGEIAPREIKGKTGSATALFVCSGVLLAYILGLNMPTKAVDDSDQWWRVMLLFPILFNVIRLFNLLKFFRFETPFYYIVNNEIEEATIMLRKIYYSEEAEAELVRLIDDKEKAQTSNTLTFRDLWSPRYKKALLIGCALACFLQMTGINGIIFYSTSIFRASTEDAESNAPKILTLILGIINALAALFTGAVIEKYGRRSILFWGEASLAIILALLSILGIVWPASPLIKVLILVFVFNFSFSIGSVTWTYLSDILFDLGLSIAVLANWIVGSIVGVVYHILIDNLGLPNSFLIFAIFCTFGTFFILQWVKETQGMSSFQSLNLYNPEHVPESYNTNSRKTSKQLFFQKSKPSYTK